jgi:putative transposase
MSFLTKRDDMYKFTIPVDKKQVNKGTGKLLDPMLPQPRRFAIKFQYECTKCPDRGVFTVRVKDEDQFPQSSDFECNPKIVYKNGLYYLALTESVQIQPSSVHIDSVVPQPLRIASADPGIATFLTVFLPHERSVYSIATSKDSLDRIKNTKRQVSYHARLERLRRKENKMWSQLSHMGQGETTRKIRKRMKRIQRAIGKRRQKKTNLVNELHFKTVNFIWNNADVFVMPYFDTERFLQSNRMRKKTKRAMRDLNFSLFRERLVAKAETQGKIWLEVTEAYSTKECLMCGHINQMSLKDRTFRCAQCEHTLPRDVKSSSDIYARNASEIVFA